MEENCPQRDRGMCKTWRKIKSLANDRAWMGLIERTGAEEEARNPNGWESNKNKKGAQSKRMADRKKEGAQPKQMKDRFS